MHRSCSVGSHLRLLVAVCSLLLECSWSQDIDANALNGGAPDVTNPCSCNCCLVAERKPNEIVVFDDGQKLTSKCVSPPPAYQTEVCSAECMPSSADIVLTASQKTMDYGRFCAYKCKPMTKIPGTTCEGLLASEIAGTFDIDGNGDADSKNFIPRDNGFSGFGGDGGGGDGSGGDGSGGAGSKGTNTATKEHKEAIKYDYRKVISSRLRAETASNIARAAAAEAYTKSNREAAEHQSLNVAKASAAIQESAGAGGAAEVEAAQQASDAAVASSDARAALAAGRAAAKLAAKQAQALARQAAYEAAKPAAKVEAESDMYRYGWDKPPNWDKVVAQQASVPFLRGMVAATWRASEYEGYAKGILGKAVGAQGKAKAVMKQANMYRATGDSFQAKVMEEEVKGLIAQSHSLEASAEAEWKKADFVQRSVAEWQQAAVLAAGHAGWGWKQYFTPPPPPGPTAYMKWRAKFRFR